MQTETLSNTTNETASITALRAQVRRCSLGHLLVATTSRGICMIAMADDRDSLLQALQERFPGAEIGSGDAALDATTDTVVALLEAAGGPAARAAADLPLDLRGTPFQRRVWQALREIPAGTTRTYTQVADQIGAARAVRAVGTACGQNPVSLLVPCHRVLRGDGSLGGYRWGLERKAALLGREGARHS